MAPSESFLLHPQAWKNATLAEQAKLPATEKPVLLSKDIEAKMMALDREVQYLLNKAKFTKPRPRPKDKNGTRTEPPLNASAGDQEEKVIPPAGEERALAPVPVSSQKATGLPLLGLHLTFGFPLGQTEEAKPISEPDKEETGELGTWGMGHFSSLRTGKLASMVYLRSVNVSGL